MVPFAPNIRSTVMINYAKLLIFSYFIIRNCNTGLVCSLQVEMDSLYLHYV